jgi:uncharacterized protein (DUF1778 family)
MSRSAKRKQLSIGLPETDIDVIDRAAALRGCSRADFVRDAAVRAAEDVLLEMIPIPMAPPGFKAFTAALSKPATAVSEMVELFRRQAPWEARGSESEAEVWRFRCGGPSHLGKYGQARPYDHG